MGTISRLVHKISLHTLYGFSSLIFCLSGEGSEDLEEGWDRKDGKSVGLQMTM